MKNLMLFFVFATILLFNSCAKESLILPDSQDIQSVENQDEFTISKEEGSIAFLSIVPEESPAASVTLQIQVTRITSSQTSGEYLVDFSSEYDFTEVVLENTQYLDFTDSNGNPSTLTFDVNDFTGSLNSLQVTFAIGSNNLSGLTLAALQDVIIEDFVMN